MKSLLNTPQKMKITENAFNAVVNYMGSRPAETGGALFGYEEDNVIRRFIPDEDAKTTRSSYSLNTKFLNPVIKKYWEEHRMSLVGIIHSHPNGHSHLSKPDRDYFEDLLQGMPREKFYTPILHTIPDGGFRIFPYVYIKGNSAPLPAQLEIVPDDHKEEQEAPIKKEGVQPREKPSVKETSITYFFVVNPKAKKSSSLPKSVSALSILLLSIAIFYSLVFFGTFYLLPIFIESILKFIAL
jgi:proteasome lid subunit RPN8/RPN11